MPTSSIDTFFACTIILAAALISTLFVSSTLQVQINDSQDLNKQNYFNSLADQIINNPGVPSNWGTTNDVPNDFGLAAMPSQSIAYLDLDKINRLHNSSFSSSEFTTLKNLYNTALGLKISQMLDINIKQLSNTTNNHLVDFTFAISSSVNSKPSSSTIHAYAKTDNFLHYLTDSTSENGLCNLSVEMPESNIADAYLVVFARSTFDDRITSFAIYNFNSSTQEFAPNQNELTIDGPIDGKLTCTSNEPALIIENGTVLSYEYAQNISITQGSRYCLIPRYVDASPQIIILNGQNDGTHFQTWSSNPNIPSEMGSDFSQSEKNSFTYLVTIKENLYEVEISFGDLHL